MHRLAKQLVGPSISRALCAPRPPKQRHVTFRSAPLARRCYSSPPDRPPPDNFDQLLASIRPGIQEAELARTIVLLMTSTTDQLKLAKLEALVSLYAAGFDESKLSRSFSKYLKRPPARDTAEEALSVSPPQHIQVDASTEELIDRAERELAGRPALQEDELAKAIVLLMKSTNDATKRANLESLIPTFKAARSDAKHASQSFSHYLKDIAPPKTPGETAKVGKVQEFTPTEGASDKFFDPGQLEIAAKLDSLLDSASANGPEGLESLIASFKDGKGEVDSEIASYFQAFGINLPTRETKSDNSISFQSGIMNENLSSKSGPSTGEEGVDSADAPKRQLPATQPFPDLMTPDPLMDSRDVKEFPPDKNSPYHNKVVIRNHASIFHEQMASDGFNFEDENLEWKPEETDETEEELTSSDNLPLGRKELQALYRFPIFSRRITQQTGKGKIHRIYSMVIVGNGDGLVGYGEGKDEDSSRAEAKAFSEAVRSMDYVERFEKRTIWTEMDTKLGATRVILRPRPVGFGLRCNPNLHQVLKAAGIKDISAKVWGSRNPLNVIKAAFRMLQSGNAPLAMGDGIGGKGRKLNKGGGARSKSEVERERGRKLINLRK